LRYFLVAGGVYFLFYLHLNHSFVNANLPNYLPSLLSIKLDIKLSVLSAGIFALVAEFILLAYQQGITLIYDQYQPDNLWYLGISYGAVLILQDTYFYFTHRWFHSPSLFRSIHQGHHRSPAPTPWTSFAFDPLEALIHSLFLLVIVFIIPLHFITLIAILVTMTIWAVLNHLGIDRLPLSFPHHWLGRWFIGPAHHSIHHSNYSVHYGLYFTFWDKFLGTQDPSYEKQFSHSTQSKDTP
jgi:sterol desaturase/sphingolipid hydroxylase (fatty acid hydroxylase superfamily)